MRHISISQKLICIFRLSLFILLTGFAVSSSNAQVIVTLNPGQTWTVPAGVTNATFYLWGGGGAGAGSNSSPNCYTNGGGGGGGACASAVVSTLVAGNTYTFSGGAGGAANSSTGTPGGNGGTTSFSGPAGTWTAGGGTGAPGASTGSTSTNNGGAGSASGTGPGVSVRAGGSGSSGNNSGGFLCLGGAGTRRAGSGGGGGGSTGAGITPPNSCSGSGGAGGSGTYPGGSGGYNAVCGNLGGNGPGGPGAAFGGGGAGCYNFDGNAQPGGAGGQGRVIVVYTAPVCSSIPVPGNTISSAPSACSGEAFTLSLQNVIIGSGITFQWQSSPTGTGYTNISGATASTYVATQTASTFYRCEVTCPSFGTGTSTAIQVTMNTSGMPQSFSSATFPPCGWATNNSTYNFRNNASAFGVGNGSAEFNFYDAPSGTNFNMTSPSFTPVPAGTTLSFDFAYSAFDALFLGLGCNLNIDELRVMYSTDGGANYTDLVDYSGGTSTELNPFGLCSTSEYTPSAGQWSSKTIAIPFGTNRIRFRGLSASGNNLYLDNINLNIPPPCSGTPSPGNTLANVNNQCLGQSVILSLQNVSFAGLTYNWLTSPDNIAAYTSIPGGTNATLTINPSANAYYRCLVTCSNSGLSATSTPVQVTVQPCINMPNAQTVTTCSATFYDAGGSGANYSNNDNRTTTICPSSAGSSIRATFTSFSTESGYDPLYIFNGPSIASPLFSSGNGTSNTGFPAGGYWGSSNPGGAAGFISTHASGCLTFQFMSDGSDVQAGWAASIACIAPCAGMPTGGNTTVSSGSPFCPLTSFTLSIPTATIGGGISYQWQTSPDNSNWANATGTGNASISYTTTQNASTYYRCVVTCSNSGLSANSTALQVITTPNFFDCYCTSIPSNTADEEIYRVTVNGASTPTAYSNAAGCSTPAPGPGSILNRYSNFKTLPALTNLLMGVPATFTVNENECNGSPYFSFGTAIWIDYNHNGSFNDAGEKVFGENSTAMGPRNINGSFTVPPTSMTGLTGMRIIVAESFSGSSLTSCLSYTYGETEDWIVNIVPPNATSNSPVCEEDSLKLFAPTSGVSFSWTTTAGNGFTSTLQDPVIPIAHPNDAGIYTVVVTTASGTYSASVTVVVNPLPAVTASSSVPFCEGTQNLNLFTVAPSAVSFDWSGPGGYSSTNQNPVRTNTTAAMSGVYTVEIEDANGCSNTSTTNVTIYALPPVDVIVIGSTHLCTGQTTSDLQALGAGPSGSYSWSTFETTDLITVSGAGVYDVVGTDINGCINDDQVVITESMPPAPPIIVPIGDVNLCSNDGGATYNSITLHTTNYNSSLSWSTSEVGEDIVVDYIDIFNVTYTDLVGCFSVSNSIATIANFASTDPLNAQVSSDAPGNITCAVPVTLTLAEADGSDPLADAFLGTNAEWVWYDEAGCGVNAPLGTGASINIIPSAIPGPHNYYVRAEGFCNNTNCAVITITVKEPSLDPTSATASLPTICEGESTVLTVNGGYLGTGASWVLYEGGCGSGAALQSSTSPNFTVTPQSPGLHTYFIRGEGDCNNTVCNMIVVDVKDSSEQAVSLLSSASDICEGDAVTLNINGGHLGRGAVWSWYEGGCGSGAPLQSGASTSLTITPQSPGLHTYFIRAEGDCNTTLCMSVNVNVKDSSEMATASQASPAVICEGDPTVLSVSGGHLGTGASWVLYEGGCASGAVLQSSASPSFTVIPLSPGIHTYFIRAEGDCNNTVCRMIVVDVKDSSAQAVSLLSSASAICEGDPVTLNINGGHLGRGAVWSWYEGGCGSGAPLQSGPSTSLTITPQSPGLHTYFARAEGDCNTTLCKSVSVNVKDSSHVATSASASHSIICFGDQVTLSVSGGYLGTGASWRWYSGSCGGTLVGIGASVNVNPTATTTYYARAEGDCNTTLCRSTTVTVRTPSTDPTSAISNAPVNGICIGGSVTLSVVGGSLGNNSVWVWYEDACGSGSPVGFGSTIIITPPFQGLHSYYVRAEGPCNVTNCAAVSVLVGTYSVEATNASSAVLGNSICLGNNIQLTANGGFLGTVADWHWYTGSCGGTPVGTGGTITVTPTVTTTYYVRAEGSCNTTPCVSIIVYVSTSAPAQHANIIQSPQSICSGNMGTFTCQSVSNATYYSWSAPNGTTFNGNNPSPYITTVPTVNVTFGPLPNGVSGYTICVFAGNGCGTSVTKCKFINGRATAPQSISGPANSCPNTSAIYSCTSSPGANTYLWTVTGNASFNNGNDSIVTNGTSVTVNFGSGWTNGLLSVFAQMSCGYQSPAKTINIVSTPLMPGLMTGPTLVCPNGTYTYSIAPVAGATVYNWSTNVPGAIIGAGTTSRSITFPSVIPAGSTVSVTATGSCGTSAPRIKNIATGLANAPGTITGPAMGQCGQTGVSYSILPVQGATSYLWTATNGATISGLNNITAVSVDFPAVFTTSVVSVVAINTCGNSAPQSTIVTGAPGSPGAITGVAAVCINSVHSYSVTGSTGATAYVWSSPPGSQILSGQNSAIIQVLYLDNTGGNVSVYASNACGNSTASNFAVSVICRLAQISQGSLIDATLYPNPTIGSTTLKFETIAAGDYKVSVVDITGQVMQSKTVTAIAGLNFHELDLSTYAKGLYMVRLEREGEAMQMLRVTIE